MVTKIFKLLSIVLATAMLFGLVACQPAATPAPATPALAATQAPAANVQPTTAAPAATQPPAASVQPTTAAPTAVQAPAATPTTSQPRVLNLWYYEPPDGALGKAWAAAQTQFLATHPGVTIHFELHTFEQVQQTAQMVLNSSRDRKSV